MMASGITLEGHAPAVQTLPLEEQAYQELRRALVEGEVAPGQKLSIRGIASALGTSPMPVRSALRRLTAEQALDVLPSGTVIVPRLSRAGFAEITEIRASLEPLAVRLAAPRVTPELLDRMELLLAEHVRVRASGQVDKFLRLDREVLFTLYRAAEAPLLLGLIEAAWLRRGPLFWEARWALMARPAESALRQGQILAALRHGDGIAAARELETEIRAAATFLLDVVRFAEDLPGKPTRLRNGA